MNKSLLLLVPFFFLISSCSDGGVGDDGGDGSTVCTTDCPASTVLELSWDANQDSDMVTSYSISMSSTLDMHTSTEIKVVTITDPGFVPEFPSVVYDITSEGASVSAGDQFCFQVYAYNAIGRSEPSLASCITIN